MQDSYEMFRLVAEELSFTKAAEKAFVTQQTASYHINALEDEYDILLFERKPSLELTDAGRLFYENVKNIKAMEISLKNQILELKGETVGEVRIGMNNVRGRILLPKILNRYLIEYPKIKTSFYIYDTKILSKMLINNEIDLFIGIDIESIKSFNRIKLYDEDIYFIATREFLKDKANMECEDIDKFLKEGLSLLNLDGVATIRNLDGCLSNNIIDRNIRKLDIHLPVITNSSDYDIQIEFCGNSLTGAFCPTMILSQVLKYNKNNTRDKEILIFKIKEITEKLRVDIVSSSIVPTPKYLDVFIKYIIEESKNIYTFLDSKQQIFE